MLRELQKSLLLKSYRGAR